MPGDDEQPTINEEGRGGDRLPAFLLPLMQIELLPSEDERAGTVLAHETERFFADAAPQIGTLRRAFRIPRQTQTNWCWAAVGVALSEYFGKGSPEQCQLVQRTIRPTGVSCCTGPSSTVCNQTAPISEVLQEIGVNRLAHPAQPRGPLNFETIQDDIARNRPIICAMSGGGSNHFVVIVGWSIGNGGEMVTIDDPAVGGRYERSLNQFTANFNGRRWLQSTRLQ